MMLTSSQALVCSSSRAPTPTAINSVLRSSRGLRQASWPAHNSAVQLTLSRSGARNPKGLSKGLSKGLGQGLGVRCKVNTVTQDDFDAEVLQSELPVLVDFWANWCGPCKLVATSMDVVDRKYDGKLKVVKVETDPNPKLVEKYKVYGLPTLIMFRDGEAMKGGRYEGAISLSKLESMIKKVLPSLAAAN